MIKIENVSKSFIDKKSAVHALHDVSLEVGKGQIYGVVGKSGAGKSTLIRCVNRLEVPDQGRIWVDGEEITALDADSLRKARQKIGMIFQQFNLPAQRTSSENIAYPLEIAGIPKPERDARVKELLSLVGLENKADAYPAQLSGGQKQRVGIARALANHPKVLLSDEATSALDPATTDSILELLADLNRKLGLTILLITHQMEVVKKVCDHVAILENGYLVESGSILELIGDPLSHLSKAFFPPIQEELLDPLATQAAITFLGKAADEPILASMMRKFEVEVNFLGGNIQQIGKYRVGQLQVEFKGPETKEALTYLEDKGLRVEVRK
ncbi:MAG: ATP-binding cassette domain-containing protein [Anaerolineaceae bacterium]